ncbi:MULTISPECIES: fumarate hydratase [unclassified Methanoculleus]|uniref:fumarate hydratase n=1 Tax=unclassified Methanoculleus TaxID=2619537 RepID=UPI0025F98CE0|nr:MULTISPECIES: fumarate hydratase [unclassified Methanoculleus]MCK9317004.1 fumarate hydratase [Methanoculleus sp.]MDD2252878.1 fumarate hydratase [Methanoculleus sp.]MDD2787250.1 fumarate hydratase [Methanoculleus sp.]MDD3215705.1 fumarate hydratase [Methanoculleus sp.]MDD4313536.1 fumarate hydratase [Methanoculleus sp.]
MMVNPADPTLSSELADATERALKEAEIRLPPDVLAALRRAAAAERDEIARQELTNILENITLAGERQVPICQDTGVPVVYLTLPPDVPFTPALNDAVREGVRRATASIPLRPNVVDPLTRKNSGDNTGDDMPAVHVTPGVRFEVTVLPKGAGSENVSRIGMLLPSQAKDIPRFVVETMLIAGGKPCPPVILGVGIGGTFDTAAALAKEALLLPVDTMDPYEQEICDAVNALGIGPMGLGGDTTALAVKVKRAGCHTASLPVAVNVQCWACRRATVEVKR